ncbi:unnamed protein product, partial [Allacma fusca]
QRYSNPWPPLQRTSSPKVKIHKLSFHKSSKETAAVRFEFLLFKKNNSDHLISGAKRPVEESKLEQSTVVAINFIMLEIETKPSGSTPDSIFPILKTHEPASQRVCLMHDPSPSTTSQRI